MDAHDKQQRRLISAALFEREQMSDARIGQMPWHARTTSPGIERWPVRSLGNGPLEEGFTGTICDRNSPSTRTDC